MSEKTREQREREFWASRPLPVTSLIGCTCRECGHGVLEAIPGGLQCSNCGRWTADAESMEVWKAEFGSGS